MAHPLFPTITLVTPVFNGARFLAATLDSVFSQDYPALEYYVIDGGSTDGTVEIIRRYEQHLAGWVSEPDQGMYDAIQKGFARSSGEIMAWLNADDLYLPWTLRLVADVFSALPDVEWITSIRPLLYDEQGTATDCMALPGYSRHGFRRGEHLPGNRSFAIEVIQQESTFWRRSLWARAGARMDTSLRLAGDFELWARFYQHAELIGVRAPLGGFRVHGSQLTAHDPGAYMREAMPVLKRYDGHVHSALSGLIRRHIAPKLHRRLQSLGARLGWLHTSQIAVYDQTKRQWKLRQTYL